MDAKIPIRLLALILVVLWVVSALAGTPLLQPADLLYLGAFRLENTGQPNFLTLEYSNGPIAFYPAGNEGRGSLFIAGHVYISAVAEFEIPTPVMSETLSALPVARKLQPLSRIVQQAGALSGTPQIMGMAWVPTLGRIVFTSGGDYVASTCDANPFGSVGSFLPTLQTPDVKGLWRLGRSLYETSRYIVPLPTSWAQANARGALVASGRHRGWCAMGPSLFAWTPTLDPASTLLPTRPLILFGPEGDKARQSKEFSHADNPHGAAWLTGIDGRQAIVITGLKDWDPSRSYYGYENWTYPKQCEPTNTCKGQRGWRAADPRPTLLFFSPDDLASVARGKAPTWSPQWYAKLDFTMHARRKYPPTFLTTGTDAETFYATSDPGSGRLFITETFVEDARPIVHVFQVKGG